MISLKYILKYVCYLVRHQHYVKMACLKRGLVWRSLMHDWHKWLPREFFPYAYYFGENTPRDKSGYYKPANTGSRGFDLAWLHHVHLADHHWQHWVNPVSEADGDDIVYPMSEVAVAEMICDWIGAGKAQGSTINPRMWYTKNRDRMRLHPDTCPLIEKELTWWEDRNWGVMPRV